MITDVFSHMTSDQSHTSKGDVAKVHDESHNFPDVPLFFLAKVENFQGSSDDCKILLVTHVPSVMISDDVTSHHVALAVR